MDIPSDKNKVYFPQKTLPASLSELERVGEYYGALKPTALTTFKTETFALYGGFYVKILTNYF